MRRLPDIPKWISAWPTPTSSSRYFPRRRAAFTVLPTSSSASSAGTGQRKRGWRMVTPVIFLPRMCGLIPRRVVSTSGNSGMAYPVISGNKKPGTRPGFYPAKTNLLDFAFFVDHVLAHNWIVLFDFHFFWHGALVLVSGVEVTSTSRRVETNFFAHEIGRASCR